jgi:hypothetical protein
MHISWRLYQEMALHTFPIIASEKFSTGRMLSGNDDLSTTHPEIKRGRSLNSGEPA